MYHFSVIGVDRRRETPVFQPSPEFLETDTSDHVWKRTHSCRVFLTLSTYGKVYTSVVVSLSSFFLIVPTRLISLFYL